jgi:hypothetical protein
MSTLKLSIFRTFSVRSKLDVEFGEMSQFGRGAIASTRPTPLHGGVSRRDGPLLLLLQDACDGYFHSRPESTDRRDAKCPRNPAAFHQHSHAGHTDTPAPGQLARRESFELGLRSGHCAPAELRSQRGNQRTSIKNASRSQRAWVTCVKSWAAVKMFKRRWMTLGSWARRAVKA